MAKSAHIDATGTPATESKARRTRTLAPDMLLAAVKRLRLLAVVLLGFLLYGGILHFVLPRLGLSASFYSGLDAEQYFARVHIVHVLGAAAALALIAVTTWRWLRPEHVLAIGIAVQVFGAYLFSQVELVRDRPTIALPALPLATVWIMAFPLVPASLRRSAFTAFAAAAMGPVAMLVAASVGRQTPPLAQATLFYLPLGLAATLSTFMSGVLYRLAADVSRERRLGSYQLVSKLAEGAMGEVWQARHRSLIRPAAIKLLRPEFIGGKSTGDVTDALRRFAREAQATALLTSPHTVALYDFGRTHDGIVYYVMELLAGLDLEELVRRFGPQPAARAIFVLRQICASLADAHRHGLVHRDIKPANLRLTVIGGEHDFVKVLDFGLVKLTNAGAGSTLATASNIITGTPAYLAPEGASGSGTVDARSDLYSLGCVAYWLVTGKLVFDETKPMAMIVAHMKTPPTPPSQRTELPLPADLERLIMELLAKDPADRPQSATEVARRLDAVEVAEPWTKERAERWWQTHLPDKMTVSEDLSAVHEPSPRSCEIVHARSALASAPEARRP